MKNTFRCRCPITSALDIIGDKWILVIVKQMLVEGKQTFKDFTDSDEAIATNILTAKLKLLVSLELVTKSQRADNKKSVYYHLTDKGISLAPVILEIAIWGNDHLVDVNTQMQKIDELDDIKANKDAWIKNLQADYKRRL